MKNRLVVIAALVALFSGLLVAPAGAATSTVTNVVNDAGSNSPWSGTEVFGADAEDTSSVSGDVTLTAGGTLTYELFNDGTCDGTLLTTQTVDLSPADGSVPNSDPTNNLHAGTYSYDAIYNGDGSNDAAPGVCESFTIQRATPSPSPSIANVPSSPTWSSGGGFTAVLNATDSDGDQSVTSGTTSVCTTNGLSVTYVTAGTCTLTAQTAQGEDFAAASGGPQSFTIQKATPSPSPSIVNIPSSPTWSSGGGFTAVLNATDSDGDQSVTSGTTSVCTTNGLSVTYVTAGTCTLTAQTAASADFAAASGLQQTFTINPVTPVGPTVTNLPASPTWSSGGGFTAQLGNTDGSDGTPSVSSSTTGVCTTSGLVVTYVTAGTCTLTAQTAASADFAAASGGPQSFTIGQATPSPPTASISNLPSNPTWSPGGGFTAVLNATDSDGAQSVISSTTSVCTTNGLVVTYVSAGMCSLAAQMAAGTDFLAASGAQQTFTIGKATPTGTAITNIPSNPVYLGSFTASVGTSSTGAISLSSSTTHVCTVNGFAVTFVNVGTCALTAHVAADTDYSADPGSPQTFTVGLATPSTPVVTNIPSRATEFSGFVASVGTTGDGATSVASISTAVCAVGSDGHTVSFVGFGVCTLTASVAQGAHFFGATGNTQSFAVGPAARGYWLVGSDGGIFSFGAASFFGSMGSTPLQRPVVGITPSASRTGYWLVASDGGIFSFGSSSYYGSIPAVGLHPAGSGVPNSLNAPIVAMVPSVTGHGYFMVASDGGVFAFGDARFAGSCPGIGGCAGKAVAVMPDSTGRGYWLVTNTGNVYAFGDATFYGAPAPSTAQVVDAVATQDWRGYWLLYNNGAVASFGDATAMGAPLGFVNGFNPATSIFPTADGEGYWIASGRGDVFAYGDAPYLGSEAAAGLNGQIIAAFGF
jgi:hypothetical protein